MGFRLAGTSVMGGSDAGWCSDVVGASLEASEDYLGKLSPPSGTSGTLFFLFLFVQGFLKQ